VAFDSRRPPVPLIDVDHVNCHSSVVQVRPRGLADKKPGGGLSLQPGDVSGSPRRGSLVVAVPRLSGSTSRRSETFNSVSIALTSRLVKRFALFFHRVAAVVAGGSGRQKTRWRVAPPAWRRLRVAPARFACRSQSASVVSVYLQWSETVNAVDDSTGRDVLSRGVC